MLGDLGLFTQLQQHTRGQNHNILCLSGDPAYLLRPQLLGPFKGAGVTQIQQEWNQAMSKVRINVEWIFGDITIAILQNAHTCLYGNKILRYFGLQPVNIADYFQ